MKEKLLTTSEHKLVSQSAHVNCLSTKSMNSLASCAACEEAALESEGSPTHESLSFPRGSPPDQRKGITKRVVTEIPCGERAHRDAGHHYEPGVDERLAHNSFKNHLCKPHAVCNDGVQPG